MSNNSSTKAFYSWVCAAPAVVAVAVMALEFMDFGDNVGYGLPLYAVIAVGVLFVSALLTGLLTRTTLASLLGMSTGVALTVVIGASLL